MQWSSSCGKTELRHSKFIARQWKWNKRNELTRAWVSINPQTKSQSARISKFLSPRPVCAQIGVHKSSAFITPLIMNLKGNREKQKMELKTSMILNVCIWIDTICAAGACVQCMCADNVDEVMEANAIWLSPKEERERTRDIMLVWPLVIECQPLSSSPPSSLHSAITLMNHIDTMLNRRK